MIRFENTSKKYGDFEALAPLDLTIQSGEWLGIFGRNGSGKTTLLRLLVGISKASEGRITMDDVEAGPSEWRAMRSSLGFMPERFPLLPHLSGEKTLRYYARLKRVDLDEVGPLLETVGLGDVARRKTSTYSKGMRQRLNLAQALLGDPRLLVLDEPIEGLDGHGVKDFFELLRSVPNRTVVISSHRLPLVSKLCDRVCVLKQGKVEALGATDDLIRQADLPTRLIISPHASTSESMGRALARLPSATMVSQNGRVVVDVAQRDKLAVLSEIASFGDAVQDIRIEEPTLEEVLLGSH